MGLKVLIVDDSVTMRRMIIRALKMTDLDVDEFLQAGNGQEGLDVLAQQSVDLALVDIHMPVMRGSEMVRKVREMPEIANLPIVIVSSEASERRIEEMAGLGVNFISKPFTPEEFNEVLGGMMSETAPPVIVPEEKLVELARAVFENMAFAFISDDAVEASDIEATAILATMPFDGPYSGAFRIAMPIELLSELADNMLGVDGEPVARQQMLDALGELTNVLGGNLLAELYDGDISWHLQHPEVTEHKPEDDVAEDDGSTVSTLLNLEQSWVRISMTVHGTAAITQNA